MSVTRTTAQITQSKFFVNVSSCVDAIYSVNPTTGAAATLASQPTWFSSLVAKNNISSAGSVLVRDMGRSIFVGVQSTVYRKVQLVSPTGAFGGVTGAVNTTAAAPFDYGTGYIELGWFEGNGSGVPGFGRGNVWARTG
jgi:hypothetical protein